MKDDIINQCCHVFVYAEPLFSFIKAILRGGELGRRFTSGQLDARLSLHLPPPYAEESQVC